MAESFGAEIRKLGVIEKGVKTTMRKRGDLFATFYSNFNPNETYCDNIEEAILAFSGRQHHLNTGRL